MLLVAWLLGLRIAPLETMYVFSFFGTNRKQKHKQLCQGVALGELVAVPWRDGAMVPWWAPREIPQRCRRRALQPPVCLPSCVHSHL